jgi:hypothetical protein
MLWDAYAEVDFITSGVPIVASTADFKDDSMKFLLDVFIGEMVFVSQQNYLKIFSLLDQLNVPPAYGGNIIQ